MALDPNQIGYFITQVGLSAASFGVAQSDISAVASALFSLFDYKCSPPVTVVPEQGPVLDSICLDVTCPLDPHAMCGLYDNMNGTSPSPATASSCLSGSMSATATSMMSSSSMMANGTSMMTSGSSMTTMATSCPTQTKTKTKTKTKTVTKTVEASCPTQSECWCFNDWQRGSEHKWCNE